MFATIEFMNLLKSNHSRVQNLTPREIWAFVVGRVLAAFGLGILAMQYLPQWASRIGIPCVIVGMILFVLASRGLARKSPVDDHSA